MPTGLLEHFELSFESGIGGYLFREGRILRRDSVAAQQDREMAKEFELLGAEVAIPILDRETLVGVAAFDGRVTGEKQKVGHSQGKGSEQVGLHAEDVPVPADIVDDRLDPDVLLDPKRRR